VDPILQVVMLFVYSVPHIFNFNFKFIYIYYFFLISATLVGTTGTLDQLLCIYQ